MRQNQGYIFSFMRSVGNANWSLLFSSSSCAVLALFFIGAYIASCLKDNYRVVDRPTYEHKNKISEGIDYKVQEMLQDLTQEAYTRK